MNFKIWLENNIFKKYTSPNSLMQESENGFLTFSYYNNINTVFSSDYFIIHSQINNYVEKNFNIQPDEDIVLEGRISRIFEINNQKYVLITTWTQRHIGKIDKILSSIINNNKNMYKSKDIKYILKIDNVSTETNIIPTESNIKYQFLDNNDLQNKKEKTDPSGCPKIDFVNMMSKLHYGNQEEKLKIIVQVCNWKDIPECPVYSKQLKQLKSRCNCDKINQEYKAMLNLAKLKTTESKKIISFNEWILNEMAVVSRERIFIDENDIKYLLQFPLKDWTRALKIRYNDLLIRYIKNGQLINAPQTEIVEISHYGRNYQIKINPYLQNLFKKLKMANYDFSGSNSETNESLFYNPMNINIAYKLIRNLVSTITPENLKKYQEEYSRLFLGVSPNMLSKTNIKNLKSISTYLDPKPNVVYFSPNHVKNQRNDAEPSMDSETYSLKKKFNELRPLISIQAKSKMKYIIDGYNSINVYYWSNPARFKKLTLEIEEYIWLNFKQEKFQNPINLPSIIYNKLLSKMQNGLVSRRNEESLRSLGVNLKSLTTQKGGNWTLKSIEQVLKQTQNHEERANIFKTGKSN
jgi:hypothetical protein